MAKRQSLFKGAFILICANILVKIIGAIFKIPLTNLIGARGMGDFSIAYNLYTIMFVVSTAGLPVAISKLVAEANASQKNHDIPKIIKCAFCIFSCLGLFFTAFLVVFAKKICDFIGSETAYLSILAISPSVFLITIVSILRGYYQGHHNMTQTAVSQVIEAFFKLMVGYFFAKYLVECGYDVSIASAGAIFGVSIGTFLSAMYLCLNFAIFTKKTNKKPEISYSKACAKLVKIAVPITIGASVLSLTSIIDMLTIIRRLSTLGVNANISNDLYGAYNMAITVYNLPQTLIMAISISIIPVISEYFLQKNMKMVRKIIDTTLFACATFAIPCSVGFVLLSKPILDFLYYKRPEDVLMASPILVILGLAVVFVSIVTITNACMQAISRPNVPIKSMIIGILVKFIGNYFLIAIPSINVSGAPLSTVLCFITISMINLQQIGKILDYKLDFARIFTKPLIASLAMGASILKGKEIFDMASKIGVLELILIAIVVYFVVLLLIGGIKKEDISLLTNKRI